VAKGFAHSMFPLGLTVVAAVPALFLKESPIAGSAGRR